MANILDVVYLYSNFDDSGFSQARYMTGASQNSKWATLTLNINFPNAVKNENTIFYDDAYKWARTGEAHLLLR